jgi:hypothetical protein
MTSVLKIFTAAFACLFTCAALSASRTEITVDLKLTSSDFVSGERIRGIIDVANSSPDKISVGYSNSKDRLFVEVFRANSGTQLERTSEKSFTASFTLNTGEGQKLETFIGDHFGLRETNRYLAKPVLVHNGIRYEGSPRAFDVVDGVKVAGAMQMLSGHDGLRRVFDVVYWNRKHCEHLFLRARDEGSRSFVWETRDLGPILRIEKPTIGILPGGEIIVLHRLDRNRFLRTEFWSMPKQLEYRGRETIGDPETAGTARVREMYRGNAVKPKQNPWWKFW